jgi:hypothetical protein
MTLSTAAETNDMRTYLNWVQSAQNISTEILLCLAEERQYMIRWAERELAARCGQPRLVGPPKVDPDGVWAYWEKCVDTIDGAVLKLIVANPALIGEWAVQMIRNNIEQGLASLKEDGV